MRIIAGLVHPPVCCQAAIRLLEPQRPVMPRCNGGGDITRLAAGVARQLEGNRNAGLYWAARRALESGAERPPGVAG